MRFQPKDLREKVAQRLAAAQGLETARMIRAQLSLADEIIEMIRTDPEQPIDRSKQA